MPADLDIAMTGEAGAAAVARVKFYARTRPVAAIRDFSIE
jgi:hypothetical protein